MKKYVFAAIVTALTIMIAGVIFLASTINKNSLHIYLVPEDFIGEMEVTFEQTDSPPLLKEKNAYIYNVPKSGKLKTSSSLESGPVEVYYVDGQGQRKEVSHEQLHGAVSTQSGDRETTSTFFIGTKEQYEDYLEQQ